MKGIVRKFLKDDGGNFAIILGLALTPVIMCAGVSVDYVGFKRVENRMTLSAESALLAASKEVKKMQEEDYADNGRYDYSNEQYVAKLDEVFKPFFEANYEAGGYDLDRENYTLEYIEVDNVTKLAVAMDYDTAVMKAFGYDRLTARKEMVVNLKVQPKNYIIDIVMCIDATGSMQNTLDAVQASAKTFNTDLRTELGVGEFSQKLKIRVRPIFYRDWEEGRDYQNAYAGYEQDLQDWENEWGDWEPGDGSGLSESEKNQFRNEFNYSSWYYNKNGRWRKSNRNWKPKTHKRVRHEGTKYYFRDMAELEAWMNTLEGSGSSEPPPRPEPPVNHGLNMYGDFIDLDPSEEEAARAGEDRLSMRSDRNDLLEGFLGSTHAFGGHDWPEAAGACLNEAVRSDWFDNQSAEAREYFKIPDHHMIIQQGEPIPAQTYTLVTPVPVVVFWSDATINSLSLSRQYLSSTTPTSWASFKNLWQDPSKMEQSHKLLVRFGPESASGFNTIMGWDRTYYGGSLTVGNQQAVKVIAEKILDSIPDMLRVGS
ncbi:TadE/TadG family type IV pilus assembly protein [Salaquimonas pukyongi]|uniref:TadE/TadG family type IV pilus assembly protein n=1 Tax=Salaquimonas pukyongi TaxID=2712698 RepID=UPI0012EBDAED|nr:hypothetical protein [Salaquimonas pukyongi]